MNGEKLLITGGLGNLGLWLSEYFIEKGFLVTILARKPKGIAIEKKAANIIYCDISNRSECQEKLGRLSFDYVIHLASINETFTDDYATKALMVNALGTRNLLEVMASIGVQHFIYFSTFHVYGRSEGTISEETPLRLKHDYATTHYFAECYVRQFHTTHQLPYTIIRLSNSYGCPKSIDSTKWYLILNDLAKMACQDKQIKLRSNGKAQRDFIWMGDVCRVVDLIIGEKPSNDFYNLSGEVAYSLMNIAEYVQRAYQESYQEKLPIIINEADKTVVERELFVSAQKLKNKISYTTQNRFVEEAKAIFQIVENS